MTGKIDPSKINAVQNARLLKKYLPWTRSFGDEKFWNEKFGDEKFWGRKVGNEKLGTKRGAPF